MEAFVVEGYRSEVLSPFQARELLALTRDEFEGFLKQRKVYEHAYDVDDLERDIETLHRLRAQGLMNV